MLKNNHRTAFKFFCLIFFILLYVPNAEAGDSMPVFYPEGITGNANPYFIWYDKDAGNMNPDIKYRISVKSGSGNEIKPVPVIPNVYDNFFFYYKFPFQLEPDKYVYTIDRLVDSKETDHKYFHSLKYPIDGEFEVDPDGAGIKDDLPPERLIEYLKAEKANYLENGYNCVFYGSASLCSFGIGLLFYKVLDFGIISKIVYAVAFTSSGAGAGAAVYYGYNYMAGRSRLQKIADIGTGVSVNGSASAEDIRAEFQVSY